MMINKIMRTFNNSETLGIRDVQIKFMWNENTLFIEYLFIDLPWQQRCWL